jgi:hypothetical protein
MGALIGIRDTLFLEKNANCYFSPSEFLGDLILFENTFF